MPHSAPLPFDHGALCSSSLGCRRNFPDDAQNPGPGLIDEKCIGDQIVLLKQQAVWSDMQAHDTNVLDFIQNNVVV